MASGQYPHRLGRIGAPLREQVERHRAHSVTEGAAEHDVVLPNQVGVHATAGILGQYFGCRIAEIPDQFPGTAGSLYRVAR